MEKESDVSKTLLRLFGQETVLSERARHNFNLTTPFDPAFKEALAIWDVQGCTHSRGENGGTLISIPDMELRALNRKLPARIREGDSGVINQMLYAFRYGRDKRMVEIPLTPGDHAQDIAAVNAHFRFDPPMRQVHAGNAPVVTLGIAPYQTLLGAWAEAAPENISARALAIQIEEFGNHLGGKGGAKGRPQADMGPIPYPPGAPFTASRPSAGRFADRLGPKVPPKEEGPVTGREDNVLRVDFNKGRQK